jgi:PAS domain S-box-containing protein
MFCATLKIRTGLNIGLTVALFVVLLISLLMIVEALQNSEHFEHLYSTLLLINALALLALLVRISLNLHHLLRQVRNKRAGARLTVRLVSLLVLLSTVPVFVIYYFSLEFLHQHLDSKFELDVEKALIDLSQVALDVHKREALKQTIAIAEELALVDSETMALPLNALSLSRGATELTLLTSDGHFIALFSANKKSLLPSRLNESVLLQLKQSDSYISLEPIVDQSLHIRVVVKLTQSKPVRLLQALFPIPKRIHELVNNVEMAFVNYRERAYLRQPLKLSFTLVLSLVLLLCIFSAVWMAFFAARRFVAPLSHLVEGNQAVAKGNYEKQLPVNSLDEMGFLVQSFNEMTRKIAQARDEVKQSQQLADSQRAYLEAVLERLSSGVISLDYKQRLRTANPAAAHILGLPLSELLGQTLMQLQNNYSVLRPLCSAIYPYLSSYAQDWREEVTLFGVGGRKVLVCCGTQLQLSSAQGQQQGYVIVFEDVTTLIQAQRDAAWSEVARRLAHEIKNPLTPIQLSAERLRHKYLRKLPATDAYILDRMTNTIIQQVDAMKKMVNVFSDYARIPSLHKEQLNINQLIKEVLDLYSCTNVPINTKLDEKIPSIKADRGRLRQVLHNLIKNALEVDSIDNCITVTTRYLTESCFECVELRISDQGQGIPEHLLDKVFEPYVTTKTKGTGLGLAIVKKIVEEHNGTVWIEQTQGICVVIRLPVMGGGCGSSMRK